MNRRIPTVMPSTQRGVALAFGLLLLVVITIVSIAAMRGSIFELQMARNEEARITAFERAQSIIDGTVAVITNLVVAGQVDDTNCLGTEYTGCDSTTVALDANVDAAISSRASVRVTRLAPEFAPAPPVAGSSANVFEAAQFEVESTYDATSTREGRASLAQGVMVLVATGQQGTL